MEVSLRVAKWALVRKEFENINMNDILFNWEVVFVFGKRKVRGWYIGLPLVV